MIQELDKVELAKLFADNVGPNILFEESSVPDEDADHNHHNHDSLEPLALEP